MVAKKYKTVEEKKLARRRINAQNYARNKDKISKRRKQQYADMVREQQSAESARNVKSTRRKSTTKDDREKTQKTGSKEQPKRKPPANKGPGKSQKTVSKVQRRDRLTAGQERGGKVSKEQSKPNEDHARVKRPKTIATHKPNATSKNHPPTPSQEETRRANLPTSPSNNKTRCTNLPPTPSKSRIPPAQSKLPSSTRTQNNAHEMDDIEYLTNYAGPLIPKVVPPATVFQLAYDKVHSVFLDYKALVGPEWISGFFNRLHATYTKDGSTGLLDQSHDRIQNLLHLMEHRLAILELEAIDENDSTRVEMGRNMYDEILKTSRTLQRFRTAAAVGPGEVVAYMRTGRLRW